MKQILAEPTLVVVEATHKAVYVPCTLHTFVNHADVNVMSWKERGGMWGGGWRLVGGGSFKLGYG